MAKILRKSKSWVAKWMSSQEFYDMLRSGQPTVLDRTAKKVIEKAKYKRANSTRKICKQRKKKGLPGSAVIVWRYVTKRKAPTSEQQPTELSSLGMRLQIL